MGADYIIMNYSVKHPVSWPALPLGVQKGDWQGWAGLWLSSDFRQAWGPVSFLRIEGNGFPKGTVKGRVVWAVSAVSGWDGLTSLTSPWDEAAL